MSTTLLEARQLYCERDDRVLFSGLDLSVGSGDIVRIAGPNGAGKTTLLRVLAGLNLSFEGGLSWYGYPLHQQRDWYQANMLFLGHRAGITASLTPLENLRCWVDMRRPHREELLWEALADVGLEGYEDIPSAHLSAGQQRRVALARLYLSTEPVWLLDEAFTAIDQGAVKVLESLISSRAAQGGAVVLSTHHRLQLDECRVLELGGSLGFAT
ncbi:heme exporter protein A [Halospina denitrificans]|uniref:Heme exporter protein A n=1 Tax=Halospina denitrificans TaxID=332522 RepID=A0A4R7JMJ7_9GAMM|nr:cytochrome c biogenesis heme-transporting ATPase CcmA [Halospina denitrificans]TDT39280.1 heme exporter protein A [Halospina denitrificans]